MLAGRGSEAVRARGGGTRAHGRGWLPPGVELRRRQTSAGDMGPRAPPPEIEQVKKPTSQRGLDLGPSTAICRRSRIARYNNLGQRGLATEWSIAGGVRASAPSQPPPSEWRGAGRVCALGSLGNILHWCCVSWRRGTNSFERADELPRSLSESASARTPRRCCPLAPRATCGLRAVHGESAVEDALEGLRPCPSRRATNTLILPLTLATCADGARGGRPTEQEGEEQVRARAPCVRPGHWASMGSRVVHACWRPSRRL